MYMQRGNFRSNNIKKLLIFIKNLVNLHRSHTKSKSSDENIVKIIFSKNNKIFISRYSVTFLEKTSNFIIIGLFIKHLLKNLKNLK